MKATINERAMIHDHNRRFVEYAQAIDLSELFEHIRDFAQATCGFEQPEITTGRDGSVHINFKSYDIRPQTGPFSVILESCYFESFSSYVVADKETDELWFWVSVSIRYTHLDGGSNGMELCRADYRNGKWSFRDAGEVR